MLGELDKTDAPRPGFTLGIRPGGIVQEFGVHDPRVGLRGPLLDRLEEDLLELLLVNLGRDVSHLQARPGDEEVGVLELERLFLLGATAFHDVRLGHALRRGSLLVDLTLRREVEVAIVPRAVALTLAGCRILSPLRRE